MRRSPDLVDLIGRCQHRLGRFEDAIASFESVVADPARAGRHLIAGERGLMAALRDAGRWPEADRLADRLAARFAAAPVATARDMIEVDARYPFHRWRMLFDKDGLARALAQRQALRPEAAPFWPESFVLPEDAAVLARFRAAAPKEQIYIVKPTSASGGEGMRVTRDPAAPRAGKSVVVQRYLDRPYLLRGRKCHLRLHMLIAGAARPRAYLHRQGIVRIAPEPYATDAAALGRSAAHVTNTARHRFHRDMVPDDDPTKEDRGNVWSFSALLADMARHGHEPARIRAQAETIAREIFALAREAGLFAAQAAEHARHCFPPLFLGLDLLPDADGILWLLECQRAPALVGGALAERIAGEAARDAFAMQIYPVGGGAPDEVDAIDEAREEAQRGAFLRLDQKEPESPL